MELQDFLALDLENIVHQMPGRISLFGQGFREAIVPPTRWVQSGVPKGRGVLCSRLICVALRL